jgi:ABC-2 type transport system permease protein
MHAQLRSEFVKLRSTRTNLGLLIGMVALVLLVVLVTGFAVPATEAAKSEHQRALVSLGLQGGFIAALIGVMSICSEFRHGTIRPTFIFTPKRDRVLLAKLISSLALGATFGIIAEALAFPVGLATLAARGVDVVVPTREFVFVAVGSIVVSALMAALGVGIGALIRNQVFAVIAVISWFMLIEGLITAAWPDVGKYLPLGAGSPLRGLTGDHLLSAAQGGLLLTAYVAVLFLAGLAVTRRRDVI